MDETIYTSFDRFNILLERNKHWCMVFLSICCLVHQTIAIIKLKQNKGEADCFVCSLYELYTDALEN